MARGLRHAHDRSDVAAGGELTAARALGTYQIAAALGVVAWWAYWFASGKYASTEPIADRMYENAFPVADLTFAALLVVAGLAWHGRIASRHAVVGLVAGGMGLGLAVIDTFHNLLVGAFVHASAATLAQKLVFAVVNASVGAWSVAYTWRERAAVGLEPDRDLPANAVVPIALVTLVALADAVAVWVVGRDVDPNALPFLKSMVAPCALAAAFLAIGALRPPRAPWVLAGAGVMVHRWLLVATSDADRMLWLAAITALAISAWTAELARRGTGTLARS